MVEILREKLKNRDLDPDNVILPPPPTPTSVFRKQRLDEDPVELRRQEAEAIASYPKTPFFPIKEKGNAQGFH